MTYEAWERLGAGLRDILLNREFGARSVFVGDYDTTMTICFNEYDINIDGDFIVSFDGDTTTIQTGPEFLEVMKLIVREKYA